MNRKELETRGEILFAVREFFRSTGYLEVDTPLLGKHLIPESTIDYFSTDYEAYGKHEQLFLIPSPEVWMKQLIAAGSGDIFQICRSFRNGEPFDRCHNPEFTMLEYYSMGKSYKDSIKITESLFEFLRERFFCEVLSVPFIRMSMDEAFQAFAGINLGLSTEREALAKAGLPRGAMAPEGMPTMEMGVAAEVVLTWTSTVGVQAAFLGKPVVYYSPPADFDAHLIDQGAAFMAGAGALAPVLETVLNSEHNPETIRRILNHSGYVVDADSVVAELILEALSG